MALKKPVVIETTLADAFSNFQAADTLDVDGSLTVNESGGDKDTRIEGDTATNLVFCDASLDAFQVGTTVAGALIDSRSTGIVFNEPGNDVDFRIEGDSCTHLIFAQGDATLENIALLTDSAPDFQTMDRGLFIGAATTAPTGNPTAGTFMWSSGNELNIRNAAGTVKDLFTGGAGSGDVVGPASATDSAVALFDTATGKLLKNSVMIVTGSVVTGITAIDGGLVLNEPGADVDFRVEGDTCTHLIFAQGDATLENIALLTDSAPNFQTMDRGLFIGAATTAPTGNPTAGTFLWSEGDELNIRNPSGTVKDLFTGGSGTTLDVQVFAASGTWTKPANAVTVHVSLIGGGGGGSSGRRGAAGTNRGGGAGGGGGGYSYESYAESALDATEAVTIGAGGAGGAGQSTNSTNGNAGTAGGTTEFDTIAGSLTATGGGGGTAGTTSAGSGGAGGTGSGTTTETGGAGGNSSLTVGSVQDGGSPTNKRAGAGGAGGSSLNSAGSATGSGTGGASGGQGGKGGQTVFNAVTGSTASFWGNPGLTGAAVIAGVKLELGGGGGGGGGNSSQATAGIFSGFGGAGGNFGAGGGGAQATLDNTGVTSEGGGRGADGLCVVVTECSA